MKRIVALALAALCCLPATVLAQAFPAKPIRLLVPYPAGGTTDVMARALQVPLQEKLGQPLILDNKPGAGGVMAAREVARSAADGYTLFFVNSGLVSVTPLVMKNAGFDGARDFAPVALVSTAPLFVVVPAGVPAADVRGFIDYAKRQPQPLAYASAGVGSFGHLASELFTRSAGLRMTHVPYKGQASTTTAVIGGEVQMLITTASATMNEFIANGRLKLLGVTSAGPSPLAPGAPPLAASLPGYKAETWFAILAPAGTPADVVARLNGAVNEVLGAPDLQQRFKGFGVVAATSTPQRLGAMISEEVTRWAPIIRENAISTD
jgi:tripartite-type tricarboxylate transporter receptor subunit TctC